MSARLTVEGIPELQSALEGMPRHVRNDVMAQAIPPAGEVVRAAIASRAPFRSGDLRGSIVFRQTQIGGAPSGIVLPNRKRGGGGHHAHLVEFGTKPHAGKYFGRPAQHPGTGARAFFNPGLEASAAAAMDIMERTVSEGLAAYWLKQDGAGG